MSNLPIDEEKVEEVLQNMVKGLEYSIVDLQRKLPEQVDGMTQKQLRRSLKAIINYPEVPNGGEGMSEREQKFIASMYALHQTQVQYEINILGQLQKELDMKKQGEDNA